MLPNAAVARTFADHLILLGGIPADRVHTDPPPGSATIKDWIAATDRGDVCELVDGTLVDRPMGFYESLLAVCIAKHISLASDNGRLGVTSGEQGFIRLGESQVRAPDVAFFLRTNLPEGKLPSERVPAICPDIAVEILSSSNTMAEMAQKRKEYFQGGCRLVWMVDPGARNVAVYRSPFQAEIVGWDSYLVGHDILPEFNLLVSKLFNEVDGQ
jgi:Uma2 family endonuclease